MFLYIWAKIWLIEGRFSREQIPLPQAEPDPWFEYCATASFPHTWARLLFRTMSIRAILDCQQSVRRAIYVKNYEPIKHIPRWKILVDNVSICPQNFPQANIERPCKILTHFQIIYSFWTCLARINTLYSTVLFTCITQEKAILSKKTNHKLFN